VRYVEMKMTYTKSAFEMPDGKYLARFLGTSLRELKLGESPKIGQDGNPMPPGMTWDFEIIEGVEKGKRSDKLTGRVPTPKSGCGKMLAAICDTILKDGVEVDLAVYVGRVYRVTILENRISDNPAPVYVPDHTTQAAPAHALAPDGMPRTPDLNARWDYKDADNKVANATTAEVLHFFASTSADPKKIMVKPAGSPPAEAKTADAWGFTAGAVQSQIPW
jgi:hypothetical protein